MRLPSLLTWYEKPAYRDIKEYPTEVHYGRRQLSPDGRGKTAIPSRLKLERILQNKTCSRTTRPPTSRWASDKDDNSDHSCPESISYEVQLVEKLPNIDVSDFSGDPEAAKDTIDRITQMISSETLCTSGKCTPPVGQRVRSFIHPDTITAFPFPPQPANVQGRQQQLLPGSTSPSSPCSELNTIIETFLLPNSEKNSTSPPRLRDTALLSLRSSPSPDHLRRIVDHVYSLLRNCSHRNFVRLGVSNGTFETVCVATGLGIVLTLAGLLTVLLRAFVPFTGAHTRWGAFAAWPMWWLGVSLVLSGLRGSCFFLLLFSRHQPLPWERFDDDGGSSVLSQGLGL